jgi:hypothetical protein
MRFTLFHLLLIFPAFFLSIWLAAFLEPQEGGSYTYYAAMQESQSIARTINHLSQSDPTAPWSAEEVDACLAGDLPDHPHADYFAMRAKDPWSRPYRCVAGRDALGKTILGIYSCGKDRVSLTAGNDRDDLNSWDPWCFRWYTEQRLARKRTGRAIEAAIYTPLAYLGLLALIRCAALPFRLTKSGSV